MQLKTLSFLVFLFGVACANGISSGLKPLASKETYMGLENASGSAITHISCTADNVEDWEGHTDVLDQMFTGKSLAVGANLTYRFEVGYYTDNNYFHMDLNFADGTVTEFRANERAAIKNPEDVAIDILNENVYKHDIVATFPDDKTVIFVVLP